jgi:hypothetical protein
MWLTKRIADCDSPAATIFWSFSLPSTAPGLSRIARPAGEKVRRCPIHAQLPRAGLGYRAQTGQRKIALEPAGVTAATAGDRIFRTRQSRTSTRFGVNRAPDSTVAHQQHRRSPGAHSRGFVVPAGLSALLDTGIYNAWRASALVRVSSATAQRRCWVSCPSPRPSVPEPGRRSTGGRADLRGGSRGGTSSPPLPTEHTKRSRVRLFTGWRGQVGRARQFYGQPRRLT